MPSADELLDFLRTRRSVRRFKPDPVADEAVSRVIAAATHAPSAHNLQPWRFVIVGRDGAPPYRQRLAAALAAALRADMAAEGAPASEIETRAARSARRIDEAPVLILLCRDATAVRADTPEERVMSIQSVANAATYLLLAAHAEGLGGNWVCWPLYAQEETRSALELPETWEPQAMIFIGRSDEEAKEKELKSFEEVTIRL
jgi:F420 biosynthesis protein FbiB-like protein